MMQGQAHNVLLVVTCRLREMSAQNWSKDYFKDSLTKNPLILVMSDSKVELFGEHIYFVHRFQKIAPQRYGDPFEDFRLIWTQLT